FFSGKIPQKRYISRKGTNPTTICRWNDCFIKKERTFESLCISVNLGNALSYNTISSVRCQVDFQNDKTTSGLSYTIYHVNSVMDDFKIRKLGRNDLIQKSAKKSCALDRMPTSLVVKSLNELLPFVSKLTERAVSDQTLEHIKCSDIYPILQSAYRAGHSTETALLKVHNDIMCSMDQQRVSLLVLLDLSAAFDTVDHQVLLRRLEVSFGITGTALKWFKSYLTNRSQRVLINGNYSESFSLPHGVPQGSCLGPLLFTIYASKLFEIVKCHLPDVHAYADDTQLYLSFKPDGATNELDLKKVNISKISERIRTFLSYQDRKSVVQALIMSRIDYLCTSLSCRSFKTQKQRKHSLVTIQHRIILVDTSTIIFESDLAKNLTIFVKSNCKKPADMANLTRSLSYLPYYFEFFSFDLRENRDEVEYNFIIWKKVIPAVYIEFKILTEHQIAAITLVTFSRKLDPIL
ncbi:Hypothetical predicted protein, partial [Paramuricea clavata]